MEYSTYSEMDCDLDGRCRDMFWEFVYIVVIPGAVLFTIVFITSILMCCNTCKRKKSDILTDEDRDRRQRHQMTRRSLTDVLQAAADGLQTSTEYKESVPTSEQQQESGRKQSQSSMQAQGSGVEYAELNHEAMTASTSAGSPSERLIQ
ncbi:hypothetical protein MAR_016423 [Mya arenaria]|uniref:Uncharacterized protein n=1 Tax=Mya arenaria TaxID=6604 RepID=A0ABY7FMS0_MYAAR|nr:hypothetical protein MAR_016423 [Mya arenaria]